ncbi:Glycerol-3-phosphate cytidylyltransferase [Dehalobacter sp. UNSWDHB]|uniref:adenylyltransferase/cytidyltransferase family protein n=1 Tax=Dehalobacter sp. UNSWDHB TaxID=1339256 RepID=UPI0003876A0D|nr:adenylyltransferase/cytidyltransferase family protein [Dehalobacter sp. UNSWDHB]EQB22652.1 Glycerol-3-phosphate cytidylyltransferase [Dehalobacter sp. UNSWDHB]
MEKYKVGFTAGVFDMFHTGHLNLLRRAKEMCDYLIVGVNSNNLVEKYKGKKTVINEEQRIEIIEAIRYVNRVEIMESLNKVDAWKQFNFDVVFIGDDWKGTDRWIQTEYDLAQIGVKVIYVPYTKNVSSTQLNPRYQDRVTES